MFLPLIAQTSEVKPSIKVVVQAYIPVLKVKCINLIRETQKGEITFRNGVNYSTIGKQQTSKSQQH